MRKSGLSTLANGVGSWFTQTASESGPYRLLKTGGGWHVMALDLTKSGNPVFFDPNLGSFEFRSTTDFTRFFNDTLFPMNKIQNNDVSHYIGNPKFQVSFIEMLVMELKLACKSKSIRRQPITVQTRTALPWAGLVRQTPYPAPLTRGTFCAQY